MAMATRIDPGFNLINQTAPNLSQSELQLLFLQFVTNLNETWTMLQMLQRNE